ncbi:unnamed protein product [marine sediment metagenome]|uniref:Uncharacterized protein n=1 Tax=marine sediment metagenome TaxID=412755 RepID=X1LD84_9ZZZZ
MGIGENGHLAYPQYDIDLPQGQTPLVVIDRYNVNNEYIWENTYTFWKGKEPIQDITWGAKGTQPSWCQELLSEYEAMFWEHFGFF